MRSLVFDLVHGVSGDMILGALADLGLDLEAWKKALAESDLPQAQVDFQIVDRGGLRAVHAIVASESHPPHRTWKDLDARLQAAKLPPPVQEKARKVLKRLAEVEAHLHQVEMEHVHFHEIGALDTLIDIAGACLGFHLLGIESFFTTAFPLGQGSIKMAHGSWREPAPATLALVKGFPVRYANSSGELCTPTGAALVTTLALPLPDHLEAKLLAFGYGAGTRNPPGRSNVLRLCLLETSETLPWRRGQDSAEAFEVSCNLDNMTGEHLAYLSQRLFDAGALDVWQQSILMKKGRMGVQVVALCSAADLAKVGETLAQESLTGGYRVHQVQRQIGRKTPVTLPTPFGDITSKQLDFAGSHRTLPEADAVADAAQRSGISWFEVYRAALAAKPTSENQKEGG